MTPTQQGRFCSSCAKQVIDFTEMSDAAILEYLSAANTSKPCVRAYPDQLDRTLQATPERKKTWYWQYLIALLLFFTKTNQAKAQVRMGKMIAPSRPQPVVNNTANETKQFIVTGTITNEAGEAIPFASIKLINTNIGTSADSNGKFLLKIAVGKRSLLISATGYEDRIVTPTGSAEEKITLIKKEDLLQGVSVKCYSTQSKTTVSGELLTSVPIQKNKKLLPAKTGSSVIKIYPNPVAKGTVVTLELTLKQSGHLL